MHQAKNIPFKFALAFRKSYHSAAGTFIMSAFEYSIASLYLRGPSSAGDVTVSEHDFALKWQM